MEILGIKFAPLNVPLKRRLETLSISIWYFMMFTGITFGYLTFGYLLLCTTTMRYFALMYCLWMYYDWDTCNKGGRSERWVSMLVKSRWMKYAHDYFPVKLVKTTDLDPNGNYLFCHFPHGIFVSGAAGCFSSGSEGFDTMFPGLRCQIVTLYQMFRAPFFRDIALLMGFVSSSEESLQHQLSTKPDPPFTGRASILVIGGSSEALETVRGKYRLVIKRRKGFVKLALKYGAPLVPVFSFGETDIYDQVKNPCLARFQQYCCKKIGYGPVLLKGRGFFQYSYGLIPHRAPITTVVGSPIEIPKIPEPTKEQIDEYHKQFVDKLIELFETHKHKYVNDPDSKHLEFVQ